jgi:hypothetical protein
MKENINACILEWNKVDQFLAQIWAWLPENNVRRQSFTMFITQTTNPMYMVMDIIESSQKSVS